MEEGRDCNVRPHYIILLGIPLQEETKLEGFKGHILYPRTLQGHKKLL